ncbi:MAG: STAS domain-containing protein [Solirubrobacteraceae bacterium]
MRTVADGGRLTLALTGELDLLVVPDLHETIRRLCAERPLEIVLDLSAVTFMDSTALRATISAYETCKENGYEFSVIPGPKHVQSLFELTGLADLLPFQGDGARSERSEKTILPELFMTADPADGDSE